MTALRLIITGLDPLLFDIAAFLEKQHALKRLQEKTTKIEPFKTAF